MFLLVRVIQSVYVSGRAFMTSLITAQFLQLDLDEESKLLRRISDETCSCLVCSGGRKGEVWGAL